MHTASSTWILPRERRSADFSTSRATVPKQHSRLKTYKRGKKNSLSPSRSSPLSRSSSVFLPVSSLRQCENIDETSASLPISNTSLYHLHPSIRTGSLFRLLPFCLIKPSSNLEVQLFLIPPSSCIIRIENIHTQNHSQYFTYKCQFHLGFTYRNRSAQTGCSYFSGLRWILQIFVRKLHFVFFYHFVYYCQRL